MLICFLLLISTTVGVGVKVRLILPKFIPAGASPTLLCNYDLIGKPLYSVKWYRGQYEFFRYVPLHKPAMVAFPLPGIEIDFMGSGPHQVTLLNVPKSISGNIKCEVSAEGTFSTGCDSAYLNIVELGIRKPFILISNETNGNVNFPINCSAQITEPPPKIIFYIENEKISSDMVTDIAAGLASISSTALINKYPFHAKYSSPLAVRCEATVKGIYQLSSSSLGIVLNVSMQTSSANYCHRSSFIMILVFFIFIC